MTKASYPCSVIVLAAGKGTRMKSELPKVLHRVANLPMISHVVKSADCLKPKHICVVIAPGMDAVKNAATAASMNCRFAEQAEQLGTGHAVQCAKDALQEAEGTVLILFGDTPLITEDTLHKLLAAAQKADVTVLGMQADDPTGYGRLVVDRRGRLRKIVEEKDASSSEKQIRLCNSGVMAVRAAHLFPLLEGLKNNNASGEYYLTDIVAAANEKRLTCAVASGSAEEVMGVNSRAQLAEAEAVLQRRLRHRAMENGVTLISPETVFFSADTTIGKDTVIEPGVVFGPGVSVGENVIIRAYCHFEQCRIGNDSVLGPYARLRPGAELADGVKIGNFVEIKKARLHEGAKINHLSYVGDAEVGARANIGAGTITCNYDGYAKYQTTIGAGAFIGSNTSLVAPVTIGEGAVVGAGSTITQDVPADALAVARSEQATREGAAKRMKDKRQA